MVWQYISMIHDCEETPFEDESMRQTAIWMMTPGLTALARTIS